jgi:hypothetical protein
VTPAQAKKNRAALWREIAREERRAARQKLAELRAELSSARAARRGSMGRARAECREARRRARQAGRELRARVLAELRETLRNMRARAREQCGADLGAARTLADRADRARAALVAERAYRAEMRRIEGYERQRKREERQKLGAPSVRRISESDDTVAANIPPEMLLLWERVKGRIRGTDRMTRTEAFLAYAHDHPGEILEAQEDQADVLVRELEARERQMEQELRAMGTRGKARPGRKLGAVEPVPF